MKAYNKKRKPKHHTKPRWKMDGKVFIDPKTRYSMLAVWSFYLVGRNTKDLNQIDKFLSHKLIEHGYDIVESEPNKEIYIRVY